MKKNITKVAYGSATTLEAIICFVKSHTAADFMYYICRVFGIALPLPVAIAIRILLLTTGGHALEVVSRVTPETIRQRIRLATQEKNNKSTNTLSHERRQDIRRLLR